MSRNYKNAYQRFVEIQGNENKTELDFIKQLNKEFLKKTSVPALFTCGNKQAKVTVRNYFNNDEIENFFDVKTNCRNYVIYKIIETCNKKFFVCTDRKLKNLYVLDDDGMTIFDICNEYELARKAFAKTIKKTLNGDTQFFGVLV